MPMLSVFDGQRVQAEFFLQARQLSGIRILDGDPYETRRVLQPFADVVDRYVGDLPASGVDRAVEQHSISDPRRAAERSRGRPAWDSRGQRIADCACISRTRAARQPP